MDLLTFLTSKYVSRIDSEVDEDWARHALEGHLEEEGGRGSWSQLLSAYLLLSVDDLDSMPLETHEWFLERLCAAEENPPEGEVSERIARLYFLSGTGLYRYLCLSALLRLDERAGDGPTSVQPVWRFLLEPVNFEGSDKGQMIAELTDILLDCGSLAPTSRYADRALAALWSDLSEGYPAGFRGSLEDRIRSAADRSGEERRRELLGIIGLR